MNPQQAVIRVSGALTFWKKKHNTLFVDPLSTRSNSCIIDRSNRRPPKCEKRSWLITKEHKRGRGIIHDPRKTRCSHRETEGAEARGGEGYTITSKTKNSLRAPKDRMWPKEERPGTGRKQTQAQALSEEKKCQRRKKIGGWGLNG